MEINVTFPGNLKVEAGFSGFTVSTDQPAAVGGDGTAPSPFHVFLASIATCAGFYVLSFLKQRGIDETSAGVTMTTVNDPITRMVAEVHINIALPPEFPEKYRAAIVRAVDQCSVKRALAQPPVFVVTTSPPPS
jgi:putative redox protein